MRIQTQKTRNSTKAEPVRSSRYSTPRFSHPVLQLQQQLGNQAVQRLLNSKRIQAKLTIGAPNDKYEQEADRVADQIMHMPEPTATEQSHGDLSLQSPVIQRMCPECTEQINRAILNEDKEEEDEKLLQAKEVPGQMPQMSNEVESTINSLRGGGHPLSRAVRDYMEPRFGQDFSQVRVYTDSKASEAARSINARAFTLGNDIVFGAEQLQPQTTAGKRLLAHELVHSLQQAGGMNNYLQRFTVCESQKGCPKRSSGERNRAKRDPMMVEKVSNSIRGLVIGNFDIGSSSVKADLGGNAEWKTFLGKLGTSSNSGWEIVGFSDCRGSDSLNKSLRQRRAKAIQGAMPKGARGQVEGFKGAPLRECMASNVDEQGRAKNRSALAYVVHIPAPTTTPSLRKVSGPFDLDKCGRVKPGMATGKADVIRACIAHSEYVNLMKQSIAIMKQVASPYAKGLADLYAVVLKRVVTDGQKSFPSPTSPKSYHFTSLKIAISSSTTLPVATFTLSLEQQGPQRENGAYSGGVLMLNETSGAALLQDQKDVERTMYHEGFHFISAEVTVANKAARKKTPSGPTVHEELDSKLVKAYESDFKAAVTPVWKKALRTRSTVVPADIPKKAAALASLQWWFKVSNEALSRVEEKIYLALRDGKGFTSADLKALPQDWLFTAGYWPSAGLIVIGSMQAFLKAKRSELEKKVLPVVLDIQKAYLRARPVS